MENYNDSIGQCGTVRDGWAVGRYVREDIQRPHESSTTFIRSRTVSCTSSFEFQMDAEGILEVTFYISTQRESLALLLVSVNEIQNTRNVVEAHFEIFYSHTPGVTNHAWNTKKFLVGSSGNYTGFVSIQYYYILPIPMTNTYFFS